MTAATYPLVSGDGKILRDSEINLLKIIHFCVNITTMSLIFIISQPIK